MAQEKTSGLPPLKPAISGKGPASGNLRVGSMSVPDTPEIGDSLTSTPQLPLNQYTRGGRLAGYGTKTLAYGAPEVVKHIYTGELPITYFNDICYGRRATPREFQYRLPTKDRERQLWEPKTVARQQVRYAIRDIQDARFRKQKQLEKQSAAKERARIRRTENALLKEAATMSRGLQAYLNRLDKEKTKYLARVKPKKVSIDLNQPQPQPQEAY